MVSQKYHFLVNALPDTSDTTAGNVNEIRFLIEENLEPADHMAFHFLLFRNDNKNLLKLMRKRDGILPRTASQFYQPAFFSFEDLDDLLIGEYNDDAAVPAYMQQFLAEEKESGWSVRDRENRLLELYYDAGGKFPQTLIREIFIFKRDLKNIVLALNARMQHFKTSRITIGDDDLSTALADATQPHFGLTGSHEYVTQLSELLTQGNLRGLEETIDALLIEHCAKIAGENIFSLNYILFYFLSLSLRHRWLLLSREKGNQALDDLMEDIVHTAGSPAVGVV